MTIDFPDIFKLRNLLAVLAAVGAEYGIASATDVPFHAGSFAAFAVAFVIMAWLIEKLARWMTGASRRPKAAARQDGVQDGESAD